LLGCKIGQRQKIDCNAIYNSQNNEESLMMTPEWPQLTGQFGIQLPSPNYSTDLVAGGQRKLRFCLSWTTSSVIVGNWFTMWNT
jgi:hypothetical protein